MEPSQKPDWRNSVVLASALTVSIRIRWNSARTFALVTASSPSPNTVHLYQAPLRLTVSAMGNVMSAAGHHDGGGAGNGQSQRRLVLGL